MALDHAAARLQQAKEQAAQRTRQQEQADLAAKLRRLGFSADLPAQESKKPVQSSARRARDEAETSQPAREGPAPESRVASTVQEGRIAHRLSVQEQQKPAQQAREPEQSPVDRYMQGGWKNAVVLSEVLAQPVSKRRR